jgi:hypothetical protein
MEMIVMNRCIVKCEDNGTTVSCDVIEKTDKHIKVALDNTTITLLLKRKDIREKYTGRYANMTFTSKG